MGDAYLLIGINPTKTAPESAYSVALYGIIFSECLVGTSSLPPAQSRNPHSCLCLPHQPQAPRVSKQRKDAKKPSSQGYCSFFPWSYNSPKSSPKYSIWLHLGTTLAYGRHVTTPHLQRIKSLCFCLGVRLLWSPSLGPENLPKSWSAWIYPDVILFQFVLIWFTASADKTIMGVGGGQKTLSVGTEDFLTAFETKYFNMAKGKTPLGIDIGVFFNFKTICFKKQNLTYASCTVIYVRVHKKL